MSSLAAADGPAHPATGWTPYERFAGICAVLAGLVGFLYSIAFGTRRGTPPRPLSAGSAPDAVECDLRYGKPGGERQRVDGDVIFGYTARTRA